MDTRTSKAARSKAASLRATAKSYSSLKADGRTLEGSVDRSTPTWHVPLTTRDGPLSDERYPTEQGLRTEACHESSMEFTYPSPPTPPTQCRHPNFPEELAHMITSMGTDQEERAEAFREASQRPPITKQSLSELDIQNVIRNIRLRHDVNFDRDLSFRPNLDGAKGQHKRRTTEQYWKALAAELDLYARLFHGTPSPRDRNNDHWQQLVQHAKCRIPIIFQTIQEVLKSLVPDRDHARVDEHLDVAMLMQEIERGVCDQVRLAEWMAHLLKEHCAPMRDGLVDEMVDITRKGVRDFDSDTIVEGLRQTLAILEAMKLDVANHQIRNLKTLLIEDTINFERHYHLDRLVGNRSRVNIDSAQSWYSRATWEFAEQFPNLPHNAPSVRLETFVRAVVAPLFGRDGPHEFPETFYLDHDRLQTLKAEIEDLIHMEVCMDAFGAFLRKFGYDRSIPASARHQLHTALLAIMGDSMGYGSHQWVKNSEDLSLEILRQASLAAGQSFACSHETLSRANEQLLQMFFNSHATHNPRLEALLLRRVLACTDRNTASSPIELFNNLVPIASSTPTPQPTHFLHLHTPDTSSSIHTLNSETTRWQDIANRLTHILLLHWRTWGPIAYVQEDETAQKLSPSTPSSRPSLHTEQDSQILASMQTGEPLESGQENQRPHQLPSQ
ncbi:T-complex protein 11-domain-containing protein [Paraphoma chrysanthemicola]|nr:T-complex protein 11-domain-containing protein [Paraphoma chrysanthemicola]